MTQMFAEASTSDRVASQSMGIESHPEACLTMQAKVLMSSWEKIVKPCASNLRLLLLVI